MWAASTTRYTMAKTIGNPRRAAMRRLRRLHTMPSRARSNTARDARANGTGRDVSLIHRLPTRRWHLRSPREGEERAGASRCSASSCYQVAEDRFQVLVGRVHLAHPRLLRGGGEVAVELVGLGGLHGQPLAFGPEGQGDDVRQGHYRPGQGPRVAGAQGHRMRVLVHEIADLPHVALGQDAPVVDQEDAAGHRLHLVQDVAGDDDRAAGAPQAPHEVDDMGRFTGSIPETGSSSSSTSGSWA